CMFRRRGLPLQLNAFWITSKITEKWDYLQKSAHALLTTHAPQIQALLKTLNTIWEEKIRRDDRKVLLGDLTTSLRLIAELSESIDEPRERVQIENILSDLKNKWEQKDINGKSVYKVLVKALNEL